MKYYIISGETSGDLHGAKLIQQLKSIDSKSEFRAWGGNNISKQNVPLDKNISELAFMGFTEVVKNLRKILDNFKQCKKNILDYNPDAIILIDYPGFNLRIARWAKKKSIKVLYFISPTVWAWNTKRVYTVKEYVDKMYVILPFEKEFYKKYGVEVEYFGHPLVETISNYKKPEFNSFCKENNLSGKPIIAILAGSRKQEVKDMLPIMIEASRDFNDYEFVIAGSHSVSEKIYKQIIGKSDVKILFNKTYDILSSATAGLVTSGTATLETALFGVPQVVCYKGGKISVAIAKMVASVKYISLVNLILDKQVVTELIQKELNNSSVIKELKAILPEGKKRSKIIKNYDELNKILGSYNSYYLIAENIYQRMSGNND